MQIDLQTDGLGLIDVQPTFMAATATGGGEAANSIRTVTPA